VLQHSKEPEMLLTTTIPRPKARSPITNIFSTKFLFVAIIAVLGTLNFIAIPNMKSHSAPAMVTTVPSISQLESIPWDMQVTDLPVRPTTCPRSYLTYEVLRSQTCSPFGRALGFSSALKISALNSATPCRIGRNRRIYQSL
jgi:hypothetical protein